MRYSGRKMGNQGIGKSRQALFATRLLLSDESVPLLRISGKKPAENTTISRGVLSESRKSG